MGNVQLETKKYKVLHINCGSNIHDCEQRQIVAIEKGLEDKIYNRVILDYLVYQNHLCDGYEIFSKLIPGDIVIVETKEIDSDLTSTKDFLITYKVE